jgi:hypothetical protein
LYRELARARIDILAAMGINAVLMLERVITSKSERAQPITLGLLKLASIVLIVRSL